MNKQTQQNDRERLQMKEWENNPTGNLHDSLSNGQGGVPTGLNTKWLGILLSIMILFSVLFWLLFN